MNYPDRCIAWPGKLDKDGYGVLSNRRNMRAHRVLFEMFRGPIPEGMVVMHKCDTPSCVNPAHLEVGTQAENIADRDRKGRRRAASKLKPEMVQAIRDGLSCKAACQMFGIQKSAYYAARNGETHAQWLLNEAEA